MAALGIKEGEWFHASKPALKAGMRPTFELKARVWCCGMFHTQSYQSECAMTKFRGKIIPLSPAGIAKKLRDEAMEFYAEAGKVLTKAQEKVLNVSRQHVRRILVELEREGLAERRTADGVPLRDLSPDQLKRLQIGRIRLYFFVRPVPSKTVPDVAINGYISFAFLSPLESRVLNKVLQRFELQADPYVAGEGYVQETVKVAIAGYVDSRTVALEDYRKAEDVAAQTLKKALDVAISSERIVSNLVSNPTVRREAPAPAVAVPPSSEVHVRNPLPTDQPVLNGGKTAKSAAVGRSVEDPLAKQQSEPKQPEATVLLPADTATLQPKIREWLVRTYALPTGPPGDVLAELAKLCRDEAGLEQLKVECTKTQNADPKSYRYFLPIARRCAEHRPEYEEALRLKEEKPATQQHGFDEERLKRIAAQVEEDRKWR